MTFRGGKEKAVITYKKLSELSIEDVIALWNRGFEEYLVNITMNVTTFLRRVVFEDLSLEHSFAAYADEQPIGIVVNGFRQINGQKVGWNGGTGIIPEHRGKGFGLLLMQENIELYRREGVEIALLEAIAENERAIKLYQKVGYQIEDQLTFMNMSGELPANSFDSDSNRYIIKKGMARHIGTLPFHKALAAWQTQWPSVKDGESILVYDGTDAVGYALYKRVYDESGNLSMISLYQCETVPDHQDREAIFLLALREAYQPLSHPCKRITVNLSKSNETVIQALMDAGFSTQVELVHMKKMISRE
jgi:ribosomal protein S18 acetylase RimI-like enzyme